MKTTDGGNVRKVHWIRIIALLCMSTTAFAQNYKAYNNFDFVAGDKILFEDDFRTATDGEFPATWKLRNGQAVVNRIDGELAMVVTEGSYGKVSPRIKTDAYLDSTFTVELDFKLTDESMGMFVFFVDKDGEDGRGVHVSYEGMTSSDYFPANPLSGSFPTGEDNFRNVWHHLSIAYKNGQMKVYVDQFRTLVIPDCEFVPLAVQFGGSPPTIFKNVRIANGGGMYMLDQIYRDGKIVTHGILFDVNKATIKPQSMGVLNSIAKIMAADKNLKLSVEGHTDSDGADDANLKLSQSRADEVKEALVNLGVDAARLSTKGWGEGKPVNDNATLEGKANNRRVEFVKI